MAISRDRQRVLRAQALYLMWLALEKAHLSIASDSSGLADDEEVAFVSNIVGQKKQLAFIDYKNFKQRNGLAK